MEQETCLCQRLEAQVVALDGLDAMVPREPPVAVHDKGDVARDGALAQRADQ